MFMGPYDEGGDWNDKGITGIFRFLSKVVAVCAKEDGTTSLSNIKAIHKMIKGVTDDLDKIKFNTSLSKMMTCINTLGKSDTLSKSDKSLLIRTLAPFAPHLSEELWYLQGYEESVFNEEWPKYDQSNLTDETMTIAIQVNGKLRGSIDLDANSSKDIVLEQSKCLDNVKKYINKHTVVKEIYIPNKLVNLVVK